MCSPKKPISACPPELLLQVFEHFSSSKTTLCTLCLVNKRLRLVAERVLYSTIEWEWKWPDTESPIPILPLLRSILARPELGRHVRSLRLLGEMQHESRHKSRPCDEPPKIPHVDQGTLRAATAAVRSIPMSSDEQDDWIHKLSEGTMDAFTTLLLTKLPELNKLQLDVNFCRETTILGRMLRQALQAAPTDEVQQSDQADAVRTVLLPHFSNLRYVSVNKGSTNKQIDELSRRNNENLALIFYLPAVERLRADIQHLAKPFKWPSPVPEITSLTTLRLCFGREGMLAEILARTPNLKQLRWNWAYCTARGVPEPEESIIHLDSICAALLNVRKTLEDLIITQSLDNYPSFCYCCDYTPATTFHGSLAGLAGMEKLVMLQAPLHFLAGTLSTENIESHKLTAILPRNLRRLWISEDTHEETEIWDEHEYEALIKAWFEDGSWKQAAPHLERVSVLEPYGEEEDHFRGRSCKLKYEDPGPTGEIITQAGLIYERTWGNDVIPTNILYE